jgi:hypothetical protein
VRLVAGIMLRTGALLAPGQATFSVDERRRAFYLASHLSPAGAPLAAALLGFDPSVVVPQVLCVVGLLARRACACWLAHKWHFGVWMCWK